MLDAAPPAGGFTLARERLPAPAWSWVLPALGVLLVLLEIGYSNGSNLVPWIVHRMDPSLMARDWYVVSAPHHLNFIRFMAWAGRWATLPLAFFLLHVASLFLLLRVTYQTAQYLFEDRRVFFVAVFLFLRWGTLALGGNPLFSDAVVPHSLAAPVCLLALYYALRERTFAATIAAAAATWIHVQLGAQIMLLIGAGVLWNWRRAGLRNVVAAGGLYLAMVAPTVVPQWLLYVQDAAPIPTAEYAYLNAVLRQPHHLAPFSWPGADYYRLAVVLALAAMTGHWRERPQQTLLVWLSVIVLLCLIGTIFVEIYPVKLVLKMQVFRQTIFIKFFAVLYAAKFLLQLLEQKDLPSKWGALVILAIRNFAVIGAALVLILAFRARRGWGWVAGLTVAGALAAATILPSLAKNLPAFGYSFAVSPRGVVVGVAGLLLLAGMQRQFPRLLPLVLLALFLGERSLTGWPYFGYEHEPADEWYLFCQQVKDATPRDALFIAPPFLEGFELYAERAQIVDFKCFPFGEQDMREWRRRLSDFFGHELRCGGFVECSSLLAYSYARLREPDFRRLAEKYQAQYVITSQPGHHLRWPVQIRRGDFVLYLIPIGSGAGFPPGSLQPPHP